MERNELIAVVVALLLIIIGSWSYANYRGEANYGDGYSAGYEVGQSSGYEVGRSSGINGTAVICANEMRFWINKTLTALDILVECRELIDDCIKLCT